MKSWIILGAIIVGGVWVIYVQYMLPGLHDPHQKTYSTIEEVEGGHGVHRLFLFKLHHQSEEKEAQCGVSPQARRKGTAPSKCRAYGSDSRHESMTPSGRRLLPASTAPGSNPASRNVCASRSIDSARRAQATSREPDGDCSSNSTPRSGRARPGSGAMTSR